MTKATFVKAGKFLTDVPEWKRKTREDRGKRWRHNASLIVGTFVNDENFFVVCWSFFVISGAFGGVIFLNKDIHAAGRFTIGAILGFMGFILIGAILFGVLRFIDWMGGKIKIIMEGWK